jgi:hypothetical protein
VALAMRSGFEPPAMGAGHKLVRAPHPRPRAGPALQKGARDGTEPAR